MERAHTVTPVVTENADGQEVISDFAVDHIHAFHHVDIENDSAYIDAFGPEDQQQQDTELTPQQQVLWDWAEENLSSEQLDYLAEQLDGADPELIAAHFEELVMIRAEMQGEDAEQDPDNNRITEDDREVFDSIITDLSGTEPGGAVIADEFLTAASKAGDNDLYAEMMMGAALFHQGKGEPQQIAERLISRFGKHEVYAMYEQLTNND